MSKQAGVLNGRWPCAQLFFRSTSSTRRAGLFFTGAMERSDERDVKEEIREGSGSMLIASCPQILGSENWPAVLINTVQGENEPVQGDPWRPHDQSTSPVVQDTKIRSQVSGPSVDEDQAPLAPSARCARPGRHKGRRGGFYGILRWIWVQHATRFVL